MSYKNQILMLDEVFDIMNTHFFKNTLPKPQITIVRSRGAKGYFLANSFTLKANGDEIHEIAMNPELFNKEEIEIISTLLHEMCHLWQRIYGKEGKYNYHNKQFAEKMLEVGLQTYDIYTKKETGKNVTHYIIENGEYSLFFKKYVKGDIIVLNADPISEVKKAEVYSTKSKYECAVCKNKVWGKAGLKIRCSDCDWEMEEV